MRKKLKFTIGIPTYNGACYISPTLKSIFSQSLQEFKIVISDDCSKDKTVKIIENFKDKRVKIHQNKRNLGYGKNLQVLKNLVKGDILFLMAQDDILLKDALSKTYNAFLLDKEIGVVTRPYYWFDKDFKKPVRAITPYDTQKDQITSLLDGERIIRKFFESVAQLSGVAYRIKYADINFHTDIFTAHVYPLASIAKKYKVVFLKDYTVAVRIRSSQTRCLVKIYDISPTESWVRMVNKIYPEKKYEQVRKVRIKQITTHYLGLAQIKNFGSFRNLIKEIYILAKYNPRNLLNPKFWFFSLGAVLIPKKILRCMVDNYKNKILARKLRNMTSSPLLYSARGLASILARKLYLPKLP